LKGEEIILAFAEDMILSKVRNDRSTCYNQLFAYYMVNLNFGDSVWWNVVEEEWELQTAVSGPRQGWLPQ